MALTDMVDNVTVHNEPYTGPIRDIISLEYRFTEKKRIKHTWLGMRVEWEVIEFIVVDEESKMAQAFDLHAYPNRTLWIR